MMECGDEDEEEKAHVRNQIDLFHEYSANCVSLTKEWREILNKRESVACCCAGKTTSKLVEPRV